MAAGHAPQPGLVHRRRRRFPSLFLDRERAIRYPFFRVASDEPDSGGPFVPQQAGRMKGETTMRQILVATLVWGLALSAAVSADEVHFKNGDRLSGEIVRMTDGKLLLKLAVGGELEVDVSQIKTFSSEAPIKIHLADGTVLHQRVEAAEPDQFAIAEGPNLRPQPIDLASVESINPPPKKEPKWTGSISGSISSTQGNTENKSYAGSVSLSRRSEKDRLTASADIAQSEQEDPDTNVNKTTEKWWRTQAQYDYFFSPKFFAFVNSRYEKDKIADLDRRIILGGGGGYQWVEREDLTFSSNLGLASLYEKFEGVAESNSEVSLQTGYDLAATIWKNLRFLHNLTYYPSLDEFSDYYLTTTGELRATMIEDLFASFRVIFNYDETPAPGQGTTDTKYLLGVGLTF
jgi:putative salt-induced outer membrane protein YdiY